MRKKETIDKDGRIADILASHPNISAEMEEYHKGEGMQFLERAKILKTFPRLMLKLASRYLNCWRKLQIRLDCL